MNIKEIKKINLQDGDIIFLPRLVPASDLESIAQALRRRFVDKKFLLIRMDKDAIRGIKVLHLKKNKKKRRKK